MPCVSSSPARRSPGSILLSRQIQGACSKPPCESHVSPEQCWGNAPAGTTTFQRTCHGSFPFPEHGFSRETSWSLGLQALLCSAGNVPVPPRGSATFFRRNHRPECGRHGVWASLVLALALSPLSRHVDRHFYRHFYRRWALAIKLALNWRSTTAAVPSWIAGQARVRVRPPGRGVASLPSARLDNAFWQIHRRGLGAPGPDQGCPLWHQAPRWTRRTWAIHPLRCPGFGEGSPAVTNPQKRPRFLTRSFATGRGLNFWGLVTAHSRAP